MLLLTALRSDAGFQYTNGTYRPSEIAKAVRERWYVHTGELPSGMPPPTWTEPSWKTNEPIWRIDAWKDMVAKTWSMGTGYLSMAYFQMDGWTEWYAGNVARHQTGRWQWGPYSALTNDCPCDEKWGYTGAVHWAQVSTDADNRSYDHWWDIKVLSSPPKWGDSLLDTCSELDIGKTRAYPCVTHCYTTTVWGAEVSPYADAYEVERTFAYSTTNISSGVTQIEWHVSQDLAVTNNLTISGIKWYDYDSPYPLFTSLFRTNGVGFTTLRSESVNTVRCDQVTGPWNGLLDATVMPCIRLLKAPAFFTNTIGTNVVITANVRVVTNVTVTGTVPTLNSDAPDFVDMQVVWWNNDGTANQKIEKRRRPNAHSLGRVNWASDSATNVSLPRPDGVRLWDVAAPTARLVSASCIVNVSTNWTPLTNQFVSITGLTTTSPVPDKAIFIVAYTNLVQYGDPPGPVLYEESITDICKLLTNYLWTIEQYEWYANNESNDDIIMPGVTNSTTTDSFPCRYAMTYGIDYDWSGQWTYIYQGARARYAYPSVGLTGPPAKPMWTGLTAVVHFYMDDITAPEWAKEPYWTDEWPAYLGSRNAQFYGSASAGSGLCDIYIADVDAFTETEVVYPETGLPANGYGKFYDHSQTNKAKGSYQVLGPRFNADTNAPPMVGLTTNTFTTGSTSYWMRARQDVDQTTYLGCEGLTLTGAGLLRYTTPTQTSGKEQADYMRGWIYDPATRPALIEWGFTHK